MCENLGASFRLPELGPIGSNGLANARDFEAPVAWHETDAGPYEIVKRHGGRFSKAEFRDAFRRVDVDGSGTIDTKEFKTFFGPL